MPYILSDHVNDQNHSLNTPVHKMRCPRFMWVSHRILPNMRCEWPVYMDIQQIFSLVFRSAGVKGWGYFNRETDTSNTIHNL